jgi:SagB-type dehydrogenase family enzyme
MITAISMDKTNISDLWLYCEKYIEREEQRKELLHNLVRDEKLKDAIDQILLKGGAFEELAGVISVNRNLAITFYYIEHFVACGLIQHLICFENLPIIGFEKTVYSINEKIKIDPEVLYSINSFAYVKFDKNLVRVESPQGNCQVTFYNRKYVDILLSFTSPAQIKDIDKGLWADANLFDIILEVLISSRILVANGEKNELMHWEFHDYIFFHFTRMKRNDKFYGGTYRLKKEFDPEPAIKNIEWKVAKKLVPPADEIFKELRFQYILQKRTSKNFLNNKIVNIKQLEALLYTAARVVKQRNVSNSHPYETTKRPYPGAGACYELEIYIGINNCEGLDKGFYYYNALNHELCIIPADHTVVDRLITSAGRAMGSKIIPQVVIIISARFLRVMWKYESISYSLILKDVGVLLQTIALVATSLELIACPIGNGDATDFEIATGLKPSLESSVGEIVISA